MWFSGFDVSADHFTKSTSSWRRGKSVLVNVISSCTCFGKKIELYSTTDNTSRIRPKQKKLPIDVEWRQDVYTQTYEISVVFQHISTIIISAVDELTQCGIEWKEFLLEKCMRINFSSIFVLNFIPTCINADTSVMNVIVTCQHSNVMPYG